LILGISFIDRDNVADVGYRISLSDTNRTILLAGSVLLIFGEYGAEDCTAGGGGNVRRVIILVLVIIALPVVLVVLSLVAVSWEAAVSIPSLGGDGDSCDRPIIPIMLLLFVIAFLLLLDGDGIGGAIILLVIIVVVAPSPAVVLLS